jgi:hypothetical protein
LPGIGRHGDGRQGIMANVILISLNNISSVVVMSPYGCVSSITSVVTSDTRQTDALETRKLALVIEERLMPTTTYN